MKKKFVVLIIVMSFLLVPINSFAKTIKDYRDEITEIEKDIEENEANSAEVQSKIDDATNRVNELSRQIAQSKKDQEATKKEIKELEVEIENKDQEIKDLLSFYQVSESENFYLKYVFGAESFEDFIYRFSVAEQLADANDKLIEEMDALILKNKSKIKELEEEEKNMNNLSEDLAKEIQKLGTKKAQYEEITIDYEDQIRAVNKLIKFYKDAGCGENDDINNCAAANVPSDKGFIKPLKSGVVTSEYGPRWGKMHYGIDIGGNATGTPAYAVAAGRVVLAEWWNKDTGNTVIINHTINGVDYHTIYMHLDSYAVKLGDVVYQGDTVGGVGNAGGKYATHLHLETIRGHFSGWYMPGNTFNPRNVINFPSEGVWW